MDIDILMEKSLENVQNDAKEINIEVKENNLGNEEDSENTILNEEVSEAVIVPTEALDKEDEKVEEEGFVYLDEDKETFSLNQDKEEKSNEEKTILDNEEVLEERVIYGGAKPLDNVSLEFNDDVRKPIYQNQNNTQNVEEILEVTKELHLNKDENEKIEVL